MGTDLSMWLAIVGFLTPLVTAALVQSKWSSGTKAVVNFVVATAAALGTVYFQGNLDLSDTSHVITSVLIVVTVSIASYHGFLRPTGAAPALETKTNVDKAPAAA